MQKMAPKQVKSPMECCLAATGQRFSYHHRSPLHGEAGINYGRLKFGHIYLLILEHDELV
jgi:hypothetical protein